MKILISVSIMIAAGIVGWAIENNFVTFFGLLIGLGISWDEITQDDSTGFPDELH